MPYNPGDSLLDKYIIQSMLGQGSFGEVYLVKHTVLQVLRAVKVLKHDAPGIGSTLFGDAQARFLLESRLGARLNTPISNPHLLQIHDCFVSDELCLLEMEYASGGSLAARMEQARATNQLMPVEAALQIALEVAGGLAGLHANDIVHRDLKPSNILFDEQGHARLADLGLAQVPGGFSMRSQLSEPRPHPGTPEYMSPEQENSGRTLKPPSDIYSLGLVLFEMLTGRNYTFQEPGKRASSLRAGIPHALDDLLVSMLSKEPEQRPWNGEKTTALLQAVADGKTPAGAAQLAESQAAESARLAQAAEQQRQADEQLRQQSAEQARKLAAEQARQLAELKARNEAAEDARREAERRERERAALEAKKPQPGFLERNWLWMALVGLALLLGGCFIVSLARYAVATPAPAAQAPADTARPAATSSGLLVLPTEQPASTPRPAPAASTYTPAPSYTPPPTYTPRPTYTPVPSYTPVPANPAGSSKRRQTDGMLMMYVTDGGGQGFWMDQTHVTNAMFRQFASAANYTTTAEGNGQSTTYDTSKGAAVTTRGANWQHPEGPGSSASGDDPVVQMSLSDAKAYCAWAGAALPTSAQWLLAASGTDGRAYPWGPQAPDGSLANFADANLPSFSKANASVNDGYQFTSPVGHYPTGASPFKLDDMAGDAWQWTSDGSIHGGAWDSPASDLRSTVSYHWSASDPTYSIGFRCASLN